MHKIHHKQAAAGHRVRSGGAVRPVQRHLLLCHPVQSGASPYLMAGAVRFDFQGYYMMAAMHAGICLLLGVLVWLFLKGTKKLREKIAVG